MGSNAPSPKKRHWLRWLLLTLAVLLAVFYLGGGWYFSGRIKAGGLDPKPPERNYDVTIEAIDEEAVVLAGGDEAIDDPGDYALFWEDGYGHVGDVESVTSDGVRRPYEDATGTTPPLSPEEVDFDSWYYPTDPADARLAFENVQYQSPLGDFDRGTCLQLTCLPQRGRSMPTAGEPTGGIDPTPRHLLRGRHRIPR